MPHRTKGDRPEPILKAEFWENSLSNSHLTARQGATFLSVNQLK
jgi:hypothetical protein